MTTTIPKYKREIDPFYRYKRDIVVISETKKYFCWTNFMKICRQLKRNHLTIKKWISIKIGARTEFDTKTNALNIYKKISSNDIENVLETYILNHVICSRCENPETDEQTMYCEACGYVNKVKT